MGRQLVPRNDVFDAKDPSNVARQHACWCARRGVIHAVLRMSSDDIA